MRDGRSMIRGGALAGALMLLASSGCGGPATKPVDPQGAKKAAEAKQAAAKKAAAKKAAAEKPDLTPAKPDPIPSGCKAYHDRLAKAYEPYLAAFSNRGIQLSPRKRSKVLFVSTRGGGSPQLFVGDARKPQKAPVALAPSKERVSSARFIEGGRAVVFTRDKDNNERYQLYRVGIDGKGLKDLTKDPKRFYQLPILSPDGKSLIGFRGTHKSPTFELYLMDVESSEQLVLYKGKGFHYVADVSPDGGWALVVRIHSLSSSELLLLHLQSGRAQRLAPSKGVTAQASAAAFAPDGKHVYVVTDEGTPRAHLRKVSLKSRKEVARYVDAEGEVRFAQAKGKALVVSVDRGSDQTVRILDRRKLTVRKRARLSRGSARMGLLSKDGKELVLSFSNPQTPLDVFALSTRTGKLRALRKDVRPGLDKLAQVEAKVERVASFDELKVPVNVYLPKTRKAGVKLPVLVSVHGGPSSVYRVRWNPFNAFWISRGFAVVEPNVRGSIGFGKAYERADNLDKRMDAVKDLAAVNSWLRKQPWADGDKLVVFGGSYGGYMTYMALGHYPDRWAAGVGAVGVVNLRTFLRTTTGAIRRVFRGEFGVLPRDAAFLDKVSPITVVDKMRKPVLIYQGATDPRVPRSEQDQLVRALRSRGVVVEYMVAHDEGHSLSHKHNKKELLGRMVRFLDQHLGRPLPPACKAATEGAKRLLKTTAKPAKAKK